MFCLLYAVWPENISHRFSTNILWTLDLHLSSDEAGLFLVDATFENDNFLKDGGMAYQCTPNATHTSRKHLSVPKPYIQMLCIGDNHVEEIVAFVHVEQRYLYKNNKPANWWG